MLLHRGGEKIHEIEQNLTYDRAEKDKKFENLTNALTAHFEPKWNVTFATYQFAKMQQEEGEQIDAFVTHLRKQAKMCDFSDSDRRIRDQIVFGCSSNKVHQKALTDDLKLDPLITFARTQEAAAEQSKEMGKSIPAVREDSSDSMNFRVFRQPGRFSSKVQHPRPSSLPAQPRQNFNTGPRFPVPSRQPFPAPARGSNQNNKESCQYCG